MSWKDDIAGTLSETSREFAGHSLEEGRAFDLLGRLRREGVGLKDALKGFSDHLDGVDPEHVKRQLDKVKEHYKPWLLD